MAASGMEADAGGGPAAVLHFPAAEHLATEYGRAILAHARHYATWAAGVAPALKGSGTHDGGRAQILALRQLGLEHGNLLPTTATVLRQPDALLLQALLTSFPVYLELLGDFSTQQLVSAQLLASAEKLGEPGLIRQAVLGRCRAAVRMGRNTAAEADARVVRVQAEQAGDTASLAAALACLATTHIMRGDYGLASEHFTAALEQFILADDETGAAGVQNNLGLAQYAQGDYAAAEAAYGQALLSSRQRGNLHQAANTQSNLAQLYHVQGRLVEARELHEAALAARRELGARLGVASSLGYLGHVVSAEDGAASALPLFRESLELMENLGNQHTLAWTLTNLGVAECTCGEYAAGRARLRRALKLQRAIGDRHGLGETLGYLAMADLAHGALASASAGLLEALSVQHEIGDKRGLVNSCDGASRVLAAAGRLPEARLLGLGAERQAGALGMSLDSDLRALADTQAALTDTSSPTAGEQAEAHGGADMLDLGALVELAQHELQDLQAAQAEQAAGRAA